MLYGAADYVILWPGMLSCHLCNLNKGDDGILTHKYNDDDDCRPPQGRKKRRANGFEAIHKIHQRIIQLQWKKENKKKRVNLML